MSCASSRCHPEMTARDLLGGRLEWTEVAERNSGERVGECREVRDHLRESWAAFAPSLIHVYRAIKFELDCMQSARGVAVMLSNEAARIRLVAPDRIAEPAHRR